MLVVEFLKADNTSISGFNQKCICLQVEARRLPFVLQFFGRDRDSGITVRLADIIDQLCHSFEVAPFERDAA